MKRLLSMSVLALFATAAVASADPIDLGIWDPNAGDDRAVGDCNAGGQNAEDELACLNASVIPAYNTDNDPDLDPATFGTDNINTDDNPLEITLDISGYDYIKLKWDGLWQFYYIGGETGEFTFESTVFNDKGQPQELSHYTFFSPRNGVPDGGTTLGLLGMALFGLGMLRRRQ